MSLQFLNPWMLYGLAAVTLPVLVHLLSRRRHHVVAWGAMQFLVLKRSERRRLRLEQLLLLLMRIGLIALLALAMARPYVSGGIWSKSVSRDRRDLVLVVDGSYSMGWEGSAQTPHATAVEGAYDLLEALRGGDTLSLIDARETPRTLIDAGTRDFDRARRELDNLPSPSGTSDLPAALFRAVQLLGSGSNGSRDIVVFTDGQAWPWRVEDYSSWAKLEALAAEQSIRPNIRVVNVAGAADEKIENVSVSPLQVSRESAVVDVPVTLQTTVRYGGNRPPAAHPVSLEVDGLRLATKTQQVDLSNGEAVVEFEYAPKSSGSHLVSVVLEGDQMPGDDRAFAAIDAKSALPVLLVDGDMHADPTQSETFFAAAALTPNANESPWVRARVISAEQLAEDTLQGVAVVVLANVAALDLEQAALLERFVSNGGGLLIALGDQVDAGNFHQLTTGPWRSLLPVRLESMEEYAAADGEAARISSESLNSVWLQQFQGESDLLQARVWRIWNASPAGNSADAAATSVSSAGDGESTSDDGSATHILARLATGEPLLIEHKSGRGRVLLMTVPIDAGWTNLPTRSDYVSFLHEAIFHLAQPGARHNVDVGEPLLVPVPKDFPFDTHALVGPDGRMFPLTAAGLPTSPLAMLEDTSLPGTYILEAGTVTSPQPGADRDEHFVVRSDAPEWDLARLDDAQRELLSRDGRIEFFGSVGDMVSQLDADGPGAEIGHLLLLVFLLGLIAESLFSRRLVRGGHAQVEHSGAEEPAYSHT